jgi:anti-anti-sigma factor
MLAEALLIAPELTSQGLLLHVSGEVYLDTAPDLRDAITRALTSGLYKRVIVDLRLIDIMDSSGIAALLNSRKLMPEGVCEMYVLVELGSQPHRILGAAGLVPRLNVIFNLDKLMDIEE